MKKQITNLLEIVGLASKLIDVLVETTVAISKKLTGFDEDKVIKSITELLKAQAVAIESELDVLRRELDKVLSNSSESKAVQDVVKAQLPSEVSAVQTEIQADFPERDEKKIPPILTEDKAATSIETGDAEAGEQAAIRIEEEKPQPLTAKAQEQGFADLWQEEVEAAIFPNATDRIVFTKALSDMASQDATMRADAAKALAGIRHELSARALAGQMNGERSEQVRKECIRSLTTLEMKKGLAAVESALTDQAATVRLSAVWGVYHLAGAESTGGLIPMLSDEDKEVRRRAATCIGWLAREITVTGLLGNLHSQQVVSALIRCLKDTEKSVRTASLGALEAITGKMISKQFPTDKDSHQDIIAQWEKWWQQELLG